MKYLSIACLLALIGCNAAPSRPWTDRALAPDKRAALLVSQMTLDEKILQIHMMDVREHPREVAAIDRLGIPPFRITNGPAGAGPGDSRPGLAGTALPAAIGLAASWDPELAKTFGRIAGQEVVAHGEHLIEGPGLNITRVPQNGRNFEYFGEDPYLSGRMGVAEVQALQQEHVIAEIKHYAANNQETARKTVNEIVDERTLREIYLPAFEAAVKEGGAAAVMAAYPSVNGEFCSENPHLLKDILRGEWGFQGFVQSDYTGTRSAVRGARAGLDLSMKADHYAAEMKAAVVKGDVNISTVDTMLLRRYTQMFRFGMFDETPRTPHPLQADRNGAAARTIGGQCAVLLKNDGAVLPLHAKEVHTIAVIGPYAKAAHTGGGGSSAVRPLYTVSPVDGIVRHVPAGTTVTFNDGADPAAAAALAKNADIVLLMVGNKDREGRDRPNLLLPNNQDKLVAAVAAANPHTVVILKTAGPVMMPWLSAVPAVLEAWYPGEEDGNIVADVVFGDVNPSGKLPMTFPQTEKEVPASTTAQYPGVKVATPPFTLLATYSEKMEVGYRWYDAQNVAPLFPFGFGLSYTTFELANLKVSPLTFNDKGAAISVTVDVTNTGDRSGAEVVQVYVAAPPAAGEPPKQLKGFMKVLLKPREMKHLTIALDPRAFSIWDVDAGRWVVVPGEHQVLVGDSSRNLPLHVAVQVSPSEMQP